MGGVERKQKNNEYTEGVDEVQIETVKSYQQ